MRVQAAALVMVLALGGCLGGVAGKDDWKVEQPGNVSLPTKARAMIYMGQADLARPLIIEATLHRNEETSFKDGEALAAAGRDVLGQVFAQTGLNDPSIRPQVVVKVTAKARFSRRDNLLKVGCALDLYQADGSLLGTFTARFDPKNPTEYREAVPPGYRVCLKQAADDMVAAPAFTRLAKAGFPEPAPAPYRSFLESLGLKP